MVYILFFVFNFVSNVSYWVRMGGVVRLDKVMEWVEVVFVVV